MANLSQLLAKNTLDWTLAAAAPAQPAGNFVGLASVAINSTATTGEWATGISYTRMSGNMAPASTPPSSAVASNSSNITFGPVSFATNLSVTASGVFISDSAATGAGTFLYWGSLAAARVLSSGDALVINAGALSITLS